MFKTTSQQFILKKLRLEIVGTLFLVTIFLIGGALLFQKGADSSDWAPIIGGITIFLIGIILALFAFFDLKVHKISSQLNSEKKVRLFETILFSYGYKKYIVPTNSGINMPLFYFEKRKSFSKLFPSISSKESKIWLFVSNEGIEFCGYCSGHRGQYPSLQFSKERNKILKKLRECL